MWQAAKAGFGIDSGIDLFEFGISTVQCTIWEDSNDIDT